MTCADIVILVIVSAIVISVLYARFKAKDSPCKGCAYAKHCTDGCSIVSNKKDRK
jgi:radical SAM protein with 4Fe4S-binding SPASM domain